MDYVNENDLSQQEQGKEMFTFLQLDKGLKYRVSKAQTLLACRLITDVGRSQTQHKHTHITHPKGAFICLWMCVKIHHAEQAFVVRSMV